MSTTTTITTTIAITTITITTVACVDRICQRDHTAVDRGYFHLTDRRKAPLSIASYAGGGAATYLPYHYVISCPIIILYAALSTHPLIKHIVKINCPYQHTLSTTHHRTNPLTSTHFLLPPLPSLTLSSFLPPHPPPPLGSVEDVRDPRIRPFHPHYRRQNRLPQ